MPKRHYFAFLLVTAALLRGKLILFFVAVCFFLSRLRVLFSVAAAGISETVARCLKT